MVTPRERDEPVRLTRIYTRGGDGGETSLGDGSRVSKLDPLVLAFGAVDELNSLVGWAHVEVRDARLVRIQNELFDLGADLCVPYAEDDGKLRVTAGAGRAARGRLRRGQRIALRAAELRPSGRHRGRRAPARRARRVPPRRARGARRRGRSGRSTRRPLVYLNRLSDLLFVLARAANPPVEEPLWKPGGRISDGSR